MARRRTRKDKIISDLRRRVQTETRTDERPTDSRSLPEAEEAPLSYDPSLIRKDLTRTALWAVGAFAVEILLYFFLR